MYIYFHVHAVEWVLPVIKDCMWKLIHSFTNLSLICMNDFNPKRNTYKSYTVSMSSLDLAALARHEITLRSGNYLNLCN